MKPENEIIDVILISVLISLVVLCVLLSGCSNSSKSQPLFIYGPPVTLRGPYTTDFDNQFTALRLSTGALRAFTGNGNVRVQDGLDLLTAASIQGPIILGYGTECGQWLNHVEIVGHMTYGLFHIESDCNYANNFQTHKRMQIRKSHDYGLNWHRPHDIITSPDAPEIGMPTGEGDCNGINGGDGYFYTYCLRVRDWQTIVARSNINDMDDFYKYYNGSFSQPGIGGLSTGLGSMGMSPARLAGKTFLLNTDGHRVIVSESNDFINFAPVDIEFVSTNTIKSPVFIDAESGSNVLGDKFFLIYYDCTDAGCSLVYRTVRNAYSNYQ